MLKLRSRKREEQVTGGQVSAGAGVPEDSNGNKKRLALIIGGIFVVACVVAGIMYVNRSQEKIDAPKIISTEQAYKNQLEELQDNPVGTSESKEDQVTYYDDLVFNLAKTKDYQGAVDAFAKRVSISEKGLDYYAYIDVAGYYHLLGKSSESMAALDKAVLLLPPSDPDTGYSRESKIEIINVMRQEYAQ